MTEQDHSSSPPEDLVKYFCADSVLNQDQAGRRVTLLGNLRSKPAILTLERTVFPSSLASLSWLTKNLSDVKNLGQNDIYAWFLGCSPSPGAPFNEISSPAPAEPAGPALTPADIKLNLIYPCTDTHVRKYSAQGMRVVTETPEVYWTKVRPFVERKRGGGRLDWVWNILEGRAEQKDVLLRVHHPEEGFLMAPDLNWDRKTISSLHLLVIVERRDIWSLRDLRKKHVPWLERMRKRILEAAVELYPDLDGEDQLKLYVHYHPTYYHFHIHIVNVALEAGPGQAMSKAFGLENIISQLKHLSPSSSPSSSFSLSRSTITRSQAQDKTESSVPSVAKDEEQNHAQGDDPQGNDDDNDDEAGLANVDMTYVVGEASELWTEVFEPLKRGNKKD